MQSHILHIFWIPREHASNVTEVTTHTGQNNHLFFCSELIMLIIVARNYCFIPYKVVA